MNLEDFCQRFETVLKGNPPQAEFLKAGRELLQELLRDPRWFGDFLGRLIHDRKFYNQQEPTFYPNEITLHRCSAPYFSVLAYIWEPHSSSSIHDHGSWGLVGALIEKVKETQYRRLDNGEVDGYAELQEVSSRIIEPGETTFVLPLDKGIHQMESREQLAVSLNVYGKSIRPGYIQFFYPSQKKVERVYPPKLFKKILAIRALGSISASWAGDILNASLAAHEADFLQKELRAAFGQRQKDSP
jgi:predicted metal-dependent enzyme (double-stranded beta helix superfamily)